MSLLEVDYPTHDKVGNRKDKLQDGVVTSYGYDDLYQLLNATTGASQENFTYDAVGNRTSGPTVKEPPGAYQHDDANRMLDGRRFTYAYDALGNQTSRLMGPGKEWVQSWDGENRLIKAELKTGADILRTVSFKYDPFGKRIEKKTVDAFGAETVTTTHAYVYDGEDIVFEYKTVQVGAAAPVTTMTHYVHGPGIDEPLAMVRGGQSYFYHADGLGSIVAITDGAQNVVQRYGYDAFGMNTPSDPDFENAYTYTGREWDAEIGLYFYRARYYDPMEGRFISKDPIGFAGGDVNVYRYVRNRVINMIDPRGLTGWGAEISGTSVISANTCHFIPDRHQYYDPNAWDSAICTNACFADKAISMMPYNLTPLDWNFIQASLGYDVPMFDTGAADIAEFSTDKLIVKKVELIERMSGIDNITSQTLKKKFLIFNVLDVASDFSECIDRCQ